MKTRSLTAVVIALALQQVAHAEHESNLLRESRSVVMRIVTLVGSPTIQNYKGIASQKGPEPTDRTFEEMAALAAAPPIVQTSEVVTATQPTETDKRFGIGMAYTLKDKTVIRILEEKDHRKGIEIWWPRPGIPDDGFPFNVLTVRHDGSFGYCVLDGIVRSPSGIIKPQTAEPVSEEPILVGFVKEENVPAVEPALSDEEILEAFKKISATIAEQLSPLKK